MTGLRRSFRLKIALLVAGLCGLVLLAFGGHVLHALEIHARSRLDAGVESIARHHLRFVRQARFGMSGRPPPPPAAFYGEEFYRAGVWALRNGRTLFRSPDWPGAVALQDLPPPVQDRPPPPMAPPGRRIGPPPPPPPPRAPRFRTVFKEGRAWRVGALVDQGVVVCVAIDLVAFHRILLKTRNLVVLALPLSLLIGALGAWWLAGRALRPIEDITRAAEGITASRLSQRIPETTVDHEFASLVKVLNEMLERLEQSFSQAERFSADASHELRTPLTIARGNLEIALTEVPANGPGERALIVQLEELQRLEGLVNRLMLLSRADRGRLLPQTTPFDMSALVQDGLEDAQALAENQLRVSGSIAPGIKVDGDETLIERALRNLLTNATKYNRPLGEVEVALTLAGESVELRISSTGPAIVGEHRERIFDRFFRVDPSRNRSIEGSGLGLSLALEIARAHGGALHLDDADIEAGGTEAWNTFVLTLPAIRGQ